MSAFKKFTLILSGAAACALTATAAAEPITYFMPEGIEYNEDIPAPEDYLRHGLGDKPVRHDQMVTYLTALAELSDKISVETIGYTHEGRPILFFVVTSPENHGRIDEIRQAHLDRVNGTTGGEDEDGESESGNNDGPLMLWFNYGVHGAESSGMDAVIPALYHFAAAEGEETEEMLSETVLLVAAILNPDGHSRRADHVETYSSKTPVTDPAHVQHDLWTEARTNHYWFDLNRQWLLLSQPESRAWVGEWHDWKPHVSADYHEMGSNASYYFHPGEPKRLNPTIPDEARTLTKRIANFHRDWLDSEARLYFTEQGFDNFYAGKGSTYPQFNGGLGILFEAGAARGGRIETPAGERTYADNIRTHFRTTLTTIAGAMDISSELKAYQRDFFDSAETEAAEDARKAFIFTTSGDRARLNRFVGLLRHHDIKVHRLAEDVESGSQTYEADTSFIIPVAQRQYRMIRGIFDQVTEFEEDVFYDVSGWTLPLAYDLDHDALDADVFTSDLLGNEVSTVSEVSPADPPAKARYGYVFDWSEFYAPRALYRLLSEDVLVRIAQEPFELRTPDGPVSFERGAVFVPLIRQEKSADEIHSILTEIAEKDGIEVVAASSGAAAVATDAVGGRSFAAIEKPSVLLLFDDGLSRYDSGEIWHLLDFQMEMPVTLRRKDDLGGLDWSRYTHLVLVGGYGRLGDSAEERVTQWVREEGGTVIAMRQSAIWAQENWLSDEEDDAEDEKELEPKRLDYADMQIRDAEHLVGGTIVATDLDTTHPLGFGYADRFLPMHRNMSSVLDWPTENPYAVVAAYPEEDIVLSGYSSGRRAREIAGTPAVISQPVGRGQLVLIADNPAFRGAFVGTNKLFMNAIFFSSMINSPYGEYTPDETLATASEPDGDTP